MNVEFTCQLVANLMGLIDDDAVPLLVKRSVGVDVLHLK